MAMYNHRVAGWFGLEGTFEDHLVQRFAMLTLASVSFVEVNSR